MKLRAGIIGLGKMGISHAAIVNPHPSVDLVAVCDSSALILDVFKKFSKVSVYKDYKSMIDSEKLDFVIIAAPTRYHYEMVKYALEKGLHTFCEKPLGLTIQEGKELAALSEEKNLVNQVGYHNHFIGTFLELKRLLKENVLGELVHFTAESYGPVVTKVKGGTWRSDPLSGGGCLYDYASHVLNLVQEIIAHPVKVNGSILKKIYSQDVEDAVYSILTLKNGLTGILSVNWSDETYRKMSTTLSVHGKNGKIICDATELKIYLKQADPEQGFKKGWTIKYITDFALPVQFYLRGEEYTAQIDNLVNCILRNQPSPINTFKQALLTDQVIELLIEDSKN